MKFVSYVIFFNLKQYTIETHIKILVFIIGNMTIISIVKYMLSEKRNEIDKFSRLTFHLYELEMSSKSSK